MFRTLADQGDVHAQYDLGLMYLYGRGLPQNDAEAIRWFRLAADQGHARAENNLGASYSNGRGVPQNYVEAARWYHKAANQGHAIAQYSLGVLYLNGQGVPRNYVDAYTWFNLAAAQGNQDAEKNRKLVEQHMTVAEITEAQKLVREWKPNLLRAWAYDQSHGRVTARKCFTLRHRLNTSTTSFLILHGRLQHLLCFRRRYLFKNLGKPRSQAPPVQSVLGRS